MNFRLIGHARPQILDWNRGERTDAYPEAFFLFQSSERLHWNPCGIATPLPASWFNCVLHTSDARTLDWNIIYPVAAKYEQNNHPHWCARDSWFDRRIVRPDFPVRTVSFQEQIRKRALKCTCPAVRGQGGGGIEGSPEPGCPARSDSTRSAGRISDQRCGSHSFARESGKSGETSPQWPTQARFAGPSAIACSDLG